jgi:hypothetical protein
VRLHVKTAAKTAQSLSLLRYGLDGPAFDSQKCKNIFVFSKPSKKGSGGHQATEGFQGFFYGNKLAGT